MKSFVEFSSLVAEYNLLPVALFVFGFSIKKRRSRRTEGNQSIQHDGFEFILIEIFAHLSVFLRISTTTTEWQSDIISVLPLIVSGCYFGYLVAIFFVWRARHLDDTYEYIKPFKWTFYNLFLSWWTRIFILALFSKFLLEEYYVVLSLMMLCIISWLLFNRIIRKNIIKPNTLLKQLTLYSERMEWSNAEEIGFHLFKSLKNKQRKESLVLLADTILEMCVVYDRGQHEIKDATVKGIKMLEWFYNKKGAIDDFDKINVAKYWILFYCRFGTAEAKDIAKNLIHLHIPPIEQFSLKQLVDNNMCDKIVNYGS